MNNSELNTIIPPEIKNDKFYNFIQKLAREENIKTVLEIGSSSGGGSTEAFVTGLRDNPNKPQLYCMEVSQTRFSELSRLYQNDSFVKCYNISSVSADEFPTRQQVIDFYHSTPNKLQYYPIERVLGWLEQDIDYVNNSGVAGNGIVQIKQENKIEYFDLVLIDGSEFTGTAELAQVYGAKYILLDDITTFKNYDNHQQLLNDPNYQLIAENTSVRNGYSVFKKKCCDLHISPMRYTDVRSVVEKVEGFMVPGQEEFLFNKVRSLPNDAVIVEIGSFKGRSTVAMGHACIGTNRRIYSIDTWDGSDSDFSERQFFDIWQENVQKSGISQYVTPLRGYSHDILNRWYELTAESNIDFIFIDGSHQYLDVLKDYNLSFPLVKNGGWIAFHDVVHTCPGPEKVWHNIAKMHLTNHQYSSTLACGQKSIVKDSSEVNQKLPIHFFTIVLNGQPFIQYHIDIFKQLPFHWHWHIVEGVADLNHDTGWCLRNGGRISDDIHQNGRSNDGTTEYLDELARLYPDNITIYRKPEGVFWDGKREMVNTPLANIKEECLLWQVDVDEIWTLEQLCNARQMFINNPEKTAAFYWCWYFVGEELIISTRNCYAQNPQQEWLRTWRYKPGSFWAAHEPPVLVESDASGNNRNIAAVNPFSHQETESKGLVFQHFAYVTPEQLQFKEQYYGYIDAVAQWEKLQQQTKFPVFLRDYFAWVGDSTQVDTVEALRIVPIAQKDGNNWRFLQPEEVEKQLAQIKQPQPLILVDGVFFQLYQTGIARVWKSLLEEWAISGFAKHIILLDRVGTAPKIPGVRYRTIPAYDYGNTDRDRAMLQQICDEEGADVFISSYYTTPLTTPSVFLAHDMIPEVMGWNLNEPMWREKHYGIQHASAYITVSENTAQDLLKCFSNLDPEVVTVAHNGVNHQIFAPATAEKIATVKNKYGINKPYFMLVGAGGGYKNSTLFFEAFKQLATSPGFDIICTGSSNVLSPELRACTAGSTVHTLQLSDEELALAYSGAVALVYPSKYEGFGMPIAEAMACGCPVITCPNSSLTEVAGDAAIYVDDNDIDGMASALCEAQKPQIRSSLISKGLTQSQKFSWAKMAEIVQSVLIQQTLESLQLQENNLIIFPDWSVDEETLDQELGQLIYQLAQQPDIEGTTLLIDTSNATDLEEANLLLSSVAMNLMMSEDLDITEYLVVSLIGEISPIQRSQLLAQLTGKISLSSENTEAISQWQCDRLPQYELVDIPALASV
jgi:glycosyltransferase involved in cell wall biosynthesis/predicted O-methyltransferase YrrM